ncbi:UNC79 [Branchiostoma lanceolatum]|uniref:UNC79 protein n=1 Tax=Branchiostoma lanceolatum TaxID=7740 RepID=A0A8S4MPQ3_BRALA|nr:UNC79 [Branchiostoma lanceolatum]
MSTRCDQFSAKVRLLNDYKTRVLTGSAPSSLTDVSNTLKYFSQTLLSLLRDAPVKESFQETGGWDNTSFPNLDYQGLFGELTSLLDIVPRLQQGQQGLGHSLLHTLTCLLPFLDTEVLDTLPYAMASAFTTFPASLHDGIMTLLCTKLLPLTLGPMHPVACPSYTELSLSAIIMFVCLYSHKKVHYTQLIECMRSLKTDLWKDLLTVIAYAPLPVRAVSARLLFHYWPNLKPTNSEEIYTFSYTGWTPIQCQHKDCPNKDHSPALQVVFSCSFSATAAEQGPPVYVCGLCSRTMPREARRTAFPVLSPQEFITMKCMNKNCMSHPPVATNTCFSPECTVYHGNQPVRYCSPCFTGQGCVERGHVVQRSIPNLWACDREEQCCLVDSIISLLKEAQPITDKRSYEMGDPYTPRPCQQEQEGAEADQERTGDPMLLSCHGCWLLVGLCPPSQEAQVELLGSLISFVFSWYDATAYLPEGTVGLVIEKLKSEYMNKWVEAVVNSFQDMVISCLLPHPPAYARVGGVWETLPSNTTQMKEGLNRLLCLTPYNVVTFQVWDSVMPYWFEAILTEVEDDDLKELNVMLCKLFDIYMGTLPFSIEKMFAFVGRMFVNATLDVIEQGLIWLQLLSKFDIVIPVRLLIGKFLDGACCLINSPRTKINNNAGKEDVPQPKDESSKTSSKQPDKEPQKTASPQPKEEVGKGTTSWTKQKSKKGDGFQFKEFGKAASPHPRKESGKGAAPQKGSKKSTSMPPKKGSKKSTSMPPKKESHPQCDRQEGSPEPQDQGHAEAEPAVKQELTEHQRSIRCLNVMLDLLLKQMGIQEVHFLHKPDHPSSCDILHLFITMMVTMEPCHHGNQEGECVTCEYMALWFLLAEDVLTAVNPKQEIKLEHCDDPEKCLTTTVRMSSSTTWRMGSVDRDTDALTQPFEYAEGGPIRPTSIEEETEKQDEEKGDDVTEQLPPNRDLEEADIWVVTLPDQVVHVKRFPPDVQLMYALLHELGKHDEPCIVQYILSCLHRLCLNNDCLARVVTLSLPFFQHLQKDLLMPRLWELLQSRDGQMARACVKLLQFCITLPEGADIFWKLVQSWFQSTEWTLRFRAVEKVAVLASFLDIKQCSGNLLLKVVLSHAFIHLVSHLEDVCPAVYERTKTSLEDMDQKVVKFLCSCLETQFDLVVNDRPLILHYLYLLHQLIPKVGVLYWEFFVNRFDILSIESQTDMSSQDFFFPMSLSCAQHNMFNMSDAFTLRMKKAHFARMRHHNIRSLQLSFSVNQSPQPSCMTKRRNRTPSGFVGTFSRHEMEHGATLRLDLGYLAEQMLFDFQSFSKSAEDGEDYSDLDKETVFSIISVMMRFMTNLKYDSNKDDMASGKALNTFIRYLHLLVGYHQQEKRFVLTPAQMRSSPIFRSLLIHMPECLDRNVKLGKQVVLLMSRVLQYYPAVTTQGPGNPPRPTYSLWTLDTLDRKNWLMAVFIIIYKYPLQDETLSGLVKHLVQITLNTLQAQHHRCQPGDLKASAAHSCSEQHNLETDLAYMAITEEEDIDDIVSPDDILLDTDTKSSLFHAASVTSDLYKVTLEDLQAADEDHETGATGVDINHPLLRRTQAVQIEDDLKCTLDDEKDKLTSKSPMTRRKLLWRAKRQRSFEGSLTESHPAESSLAPHASRVKKKATWSSTRSTKSTKSTRSNATSKTSSSSISTKASIGSRGSKQSVGSKVSHKSSSQSTGSRFSTVTQPSIHEEDIMVTRCSDCGVELESYDNETIGLGIVVLSTFLHNHATLAVPYLKEILQTAVTIAANPPVPWLANSTVSVPGSCTSVALQFVRCALHQLAPNGIFLQLFQAQVDKPLQFWKTVAQALTNCSQVDMLKALQFLLEGVNSEKTMSQQSLLVILTNLALYMDSMPQDPSAQWAPVIAQFQLFFSELPKLFPPGQDSAATLQVMLLLLKTPTPAAIRGLLEPFSKFLVFCMRSCQVQLQQVVDICVQSNLIFPRDREKVHLSRALVMELVQAVKHRSTLSDNNLLLLVQFVCFDSGTRIYMPCPLAQQQAHPICHGQTGAVECLHQHMFDCVEFLTSMHTISKLRAVLKLQNLSEDTLGSQVKTGIAQLLAIEFTLNNQRAMTRFLPWLAYPGINPQQGLREMFECVAHLRLLSWIILGSLNHMAMCPSSDVPCHPLPLDTSLQIADLALVVLDSYPEHTKASVYQMSSLAQVFILCQLWTIYCEQVAVFNTSHGDMYRTTCLAVMEFWMKVAPIFIQIASYSKSHGEMVNLHLLSLLEGLQEVNSSLLVQLYPMLVTILYIHEGSLSAGLRHRIQEIQNCPPPDPITPEARELNKALLKCLQRLQYKMGQLEVQSSAATQFFTV